MNIDCRILRLTLITTKSRVVAMFVILNTRFGSNVPQTDGLNTFPYDIEEDYIVVGITCLLQPQSELIQ